MQFLNVPGSFLMLGSMIPFVASLYYRYQMYHLNKLTSSEAIGPGPAFLNGVAKPLYKMESPLTRTPCCYYKVMVRGMNGEGNDTIRDESTEMVPFLLTQGFGLISVDPFKLNLQFEPQFTCRSNVGDLPLEVKERLANCGMDIERSYLSGLHIGEWVIPNDADIMIEGEIAPPDEKRKEEQRAFYQKTNEGTGMLKGFSKLSQFVVAPFSETAAEKVANTLSMVSQPYVRPLVHQFQRLRLLDAEPASGMVLRSTRKTNLRVYFGSKETNLETFQRKANDWQRWFILFFAPGLVLVCIAHLYR